MAPTSSSISNATNEASHKRPRAETLSASSDPAVQHGGESASSAPTGPRTRGQVTVKRRKDAAGDVSESGTSGGQSDVPLKKPGAPQIRSTRAVRHSGPAPVTGRAAAPGAKPVISISDDEDSNIDSDGDQGISAVKARARTAAQLAGVQATNSRAARFAQKFAGKTPEETLAILARGWHSDIYKHFRQPEIIPNKSGEIVHHFVCKKHPSKHVDRLEIQDSTGNLARHVKACDPEETTEMELIEAYASGTQYSPARIVDDPELRVILKSLYAKVQLPSRATISRDVQNIHTLSKKHVVEMFKKLAGKVHICIDGWTAPNVISFLGIKHIILEFIKLTERHTAKYMAERLAECLRDFGLEKKILAITADNHEVNNALVRELKKILSETRGKDGRGRCFAHSLVLTTKGVMSPFTGKKGAAPRKEVVALRDADEDDRDNTEVPLGGEHARDRADDRLIEDVEREEDHEPLLVNDDDLKLGQVALEKLARLSQKVWFSPTIRAELARLTDDAGINSEVLVRMVKTRWNTVTMVLERAIELKPVLADLCDMHRFNQSDGVRLRRFILTDQEWTFLEQLYLLLDPFLFATNEISASTRGLVHEVIPYIDVLTKHLDDFQDNLDLLPAIRLAAKRGRKVLNKYYGLTDESSMYRVAMILHPAFKETYFRKADWPADWIAEARRLIELEWAKYKASGDHTATGDKAAVAQTGSSRRERPGRLAVPGRQPQAMRDLFSEINARAASANSGDALLEYLQAPPQSTVKDPLAYWNAAIQSGSEDRALAQMALDFLSIPATSVDAERAFSRGRLMVNQLRTSLSDKSVHAGTVLASWTRIPGLVPEEEMVAFLADKRGARARVGQVDVEQELDVASEFDVPDDTDPELETEDDGMYRQSGTSEGEPPAFSDDDMYA